LWLIDKHICELINTNACLSQLLSCVT